MATKENTESGIVLDESVQPELSPEEEKPKKGGKKTAEKTGALTEQEVNDYFKALKEELLVEATKAAKDIVASARVEADSILQTATVQAKSYQKATDDTEKRIENALQDKRVKELAKKITTYYEERIPFIAPVFPNMTDGQMRVKIAIRGKTISIRRGIQVMLPRNYVEEYERSQRQMMRTQRLKDANKNIRLDKD